MKTRAEAVAYLKSLGFFSSERDWSMGETICAALKLSKVEIETLRIFPQAVYIYPMDGLWGVDDMDGPRTAHKYKASLKEACDIAARILSEARDNATPRVF